MNIQLNAFQLKILGVILMVCDHIYVYFHPWGAPLWLTELGRLVAPIFLYLSVDAFVKTQRKVVYVKRLFVFSSLMVLGNSVLTYALPSKAELTFNIFGLFWLCSWLFLAWELMRAAKSAPTYTHRFFQTSVAVAMFLIPVMSFWIGAVARAFVTDQNQALISGLLMVNRLVADPVYVEGSFVFVALGIWFYAFQRYRWLQLAGILLAGALFYGIEPYGQGYQWMMVFAVIPLAFYNQQRGRDWRYFFYWVYPLHIWALYSVQAVISSDY